MGRTRFRYNVATCRYEPFYVKGKVLRNRMLIFLSLSLAVAVGALGLLRAQLQGFKWAVAVFTEVFKDRHSSSHQFFRHRAGGYDLASL